MQKFAQGFVCRFFTGAPETIDADGHHVCGREANQKLGYQARTKVKTSSDIIGS